MDQDLSTDIHYELDDYNQEGGGSEKSESLDQYIMKIANAVKNSESLDTDIKNKINFKKNIPQKVPITMLGGSKNDGVVEVTESVVTSDSLSDMISEMSGGSKSMGLKTVTNDIPINYSEQESDNKSKEVSLSLSDSLNNEKLDSVFLDSEFLLESGVADSETSFNPSTTSEISFVDLDSNKSKDQMKKKNIKKTNKKRISKMKHKFNNRFNDI